MAHRALRQRRRLLLCCFLVFGVAGPLDLHLPGTGLNAGELRLEVRETAGIRRFSYPVTTTLKLPIAVPTNTRFRLRRGDRVIRAQFSPFETSSNLASKVALDFNVSHAPYESLTYTVEYGVELKAVVPRGRMSVHKKEDRIEVDHSPGLHYSVPRNLARLLTSVKTDRGEFLRNDSGGLALHLRSGRKIRLGESVSKTRAEIVYQGPMACALRFIPAIPDQGGKPIRSTVHLHFPGSKSWVRVDWMIDDPGDRIAEVEAALGV